jgi:hypothetical protein
LVVVLERKTYIHDLGQLTILHTIDTVSNARGPLTYTCEAYHEMPAVAKHSVSFDWWIYCLLIKRKKQRH